MGRTVTYKGAAARSFIEAMAGTKAITDEARAERIATMVFGELKAGDKEAMARARLIIMSVAKDGLEKTADALTRKL